MADDAAATATAEVDEAIEDAVETDEAREAFAAEFADLVGDGFLESHVVPGKDLWVRVSRDAWISSITAARDQMGCTWLDFVSAIDWLPSPFGRDMESEQDWVVHGRDEKEAEVMEHGYAGGSTRFQMLCRLVNIETGASVTLKADLPDDDVSVPTLIPVFPGANWHEREIWEMFGIHITGHPDLRSLYLPSGFEGNPMRKDYPLLARRVKPWPGIVDVEQMPGEDDDDSGADA